MTGHARLPDEFALVAACCRWPPSAERDRVVRAAAANVIDWDRVLQLVARHRVDGLVHAALVAAGVPAIVPVLAVRAQRIAFRNGVLTDESVRLQAAFDAGQIPAMILKGSALAQLAYGLLTLKQARDIDVLVPADNVDAAMRKLEADGYRRIWPRGRLNAAQRRALVRYGKEVEYLHPGNNFRLELQWRLTENPVLLPDIGARSAAQTVRLPDGRTLRTLADEDLFAYLCVHGALHSWSRLKWLADLNARIAPRNAAEIARLYRHAESKAAGLCAGQALVLCATIFGRPLPPELSAELRASRRVQYLVGVALTAMAAPVEGRASLAAVTRNILVPFLLGRGWRYFAGQCRTVSVGVVDVIRLPLPAPLHFLYPLLRLPLWLWRRTIGAGRKPQGRRGSA
jgi:hypothetical protein